MPLSPPPPGNRGVFAHVVSPGVGQWQILSWPGAGALEYHTPALGHLTLVFSKDDGLDYREKRGLCKSQSFPPKDSNNWIDLLGKPYILFVCLFACFFTREKTRTARAAKSGKLFITKKRSRMKTKPKLEHVDMHV